MKTYKTVKKYYWVEEIYDVTSLVDDINNQYLNNSVSPININYNAGFTSTSADELLDDYDLEVKNEDGNGDVE